LFVEAVVAASADTQHFDEAVQRPVRLEILMAVQPDVGPGSALQTQHLEF